MLPFGIGNYLNLDFFLDDSHNFSENQFVWDLTWSSVSYIVDGITCGHN